MMGDGLGATSRRTLLRSRNRFGRFQYASSLAPVLLLVGCVSSCGVDAQNSGVPVLPAERSVQADGAELSEGQSGGLAESQAAADARPVGSFDRGELVQVAWIPQGARIEREMAQTLRLPADTVALGRLYAETAVGGMAETGTVADLQASVSESMKPFQARSFRVLLAESHLYDEARDARLGPPRIDVLVVDGPRFEADELEFLLRTRPGARRHELNSSGGSSAVMAEYSSGVGLSWRVRERFGVHATYEGGVLGDQRSEELLVRFAESLDVVEVGQ